MIIKNSEDPAIKSRDDGAHCDMTAHVTPPGWYHFETARKIKKNKIITRDYFNTSFIAYRDSQGQVNIFHAYCPHLGAHIGIGGKIKNDNVVCPFHGWQYNADGNCVHIPYCEKIPKKAQLSRYQSLEKDGEIYFYYGAKSE